MKLSFKAYIVLFILVICASVITAQEGSFIGSDIRVGKLEVFKRNDGGLKITINAKGGGKANTFICKRINEQKDVYEAEMSYSKRFFENDEKVLHVKYHANEDYFEVYILDDNNIALTHILYTRDRKALKTKMKALSFLSKFKQNLAIMSDSKKKFSPMVGEMISSVTGAKPGFGRAGKIVFFSEKPVIGKEDPSKVKKEFKVGEPVWAVAYLPKPYGEMKEAYYDYYDKKLRKRRYFISVGMFDDDKKSIRDEGRLISRTSVKEISKTDLQKTSLVFQVIPSLKENEMNEDGAAFISERIDEVFNKGKYNVKIGLNAIYPAERKDLAVSGIFTLDLSQGTDEFEKIATIINKKKFDAKELPLARKKDSNLEAKLKQAVIDHAYGDSYYADTKWKNVIITSKDWDVLKTRRSDELHFTIKGLYLNGSITFTGRNGGDCGYMNFTFIKKYLGGGRYSNTIKVYGGGNSIDITHVNCDKVK